MEKEINDQPHAVGDTLLGRTDEAGRLVLDELRISEEDLRSIDRIVVIACGTAAYAGMVAKYAIEHWTRIPVEVELAHEFRYRDPVRQRAHPRRLDQPVRRDDGHPDGGQARPRARRAHHLDLQHPRLDDPARVRRRALHPRRPRDRRRVDQGVPRPDHRLLPPRPLPRPAARRHLRRRRAGGHGGAARRSRPRSRRVLGRPGPGPRDRPLHGRHPLGAVPRPPRRLPGRAWRARSSSRSWPTSTPRGSPPASSSTARSR